MDAMVSEVFAAGATGTLFAAHGRAKYAGSGNAGGASGGWHCPSGVSRAFPAGTTLVAAQASVASPREVALRWACAAVAVAWSWRAQERGQECGLSHLRTAFSTEGATPGAHNAVAAVAMGFHREAPSLPRHPPLPPGMEASSSLSGGCQCRPECRPSKLSILGRRCLLTTADGDGRRCNARKTSGKTRRNQKKAECIWKQGKWSLSPAYVEDSLLNSGADCKPV
mmetsp:Transcript_31261/g.86036  ORF Transcript_31261/g.86036 Transcript_31261/m.86036 type:complete len:225 (+) Transcript_31261:373-1047(+)